MKVVLKREVKGVGKAGDIKNVSDGYAMNFLLSKGFAEAATPGVLARMEREKDAKKEEAAKNATLAAAAAERLAGARIVLRRKTKGRKLFGSLRAPEIAEAIVSEEGIPGVEAGHIVLQKPIKEVGEYPVSADFGSATAKFQIVIEGEE